MPINHGVDAEIQRIGIVLQNFVHPQTKQPLTRDEKGNFFCMAGNQNTVYTCREDCCDFVTPDHAVGPARNAYDEAYRRKEIPFLTAGAVAEAWADDTVPWRKTMLQSMGALAGRRMLLVGNGASFKEFHFLSLGAYLVFTDLSLVAVREAQAQFRRSEFFPKYQDRIEFHAVDAVRMPFADESFDIIYGAKFANFLPSLPEFLSEVRRCLKAGGVCRFCDDAKSPAWEAVRRGVVLPLKAMRGSKGSLDAVRSATDFGMSKDALDPFVRSVGFSRIVFLREPFFFLRVGQLFCGKLLNWDAKKLRWVRPFYFLLKGVDSSLARTDWMQRNSLGLIWGFDR
jgi:SAM-dependent methyltransferase